MCTKRSYFCFTSDGLDSTGKAISWTADRCYCSSFFLFTIFWPPCPFPFAIPVISTHAS